MGMSDGDTFEEIYLHIREQIQIYAIDIYNECNASYEINDGLQQAQKRNFHIFFTGLEKAYKGTKGSTLVGNNKEGQSQEIY